MRQAVGLSEKKWIARHRISVEDYYRMGEAGVFAPDARVELIEGDVIDMAPIGSPHAGTVTLLTRIFYSTIGDKAVVSVQNPVRLGPYSEPEPDLAVLRTRPDFYRGSHPTPEDVFLVIEVADTSLPLDRDVKVPLYAKSGIPEVWLIDLTNRLLTIYREPSGEIYRDVRTTPAPGVVTLSQLPEVCLDLSGLFAQHAGC